MCMKIVLLLLMTVGFSCSKEKEGCWECDRNLSTEKVTVCNDSNDPPTIWKDGNGNSFGVYNCKKR